MLRRPAAAKYPCVRNTQEINAGYRMRLTLGLSSKIILIGGGALAVLAEERLVVDAVGETEAQSGGDLLDLCGVSDRFGGLVDREAVGVDGARGGPQVLLQGAEPLEHVFDDMAGRSDIQPFSTVLL